MRTLPLRRASLSSPSPCQEGSEATCLPSSHLYAMHMHCIYLYLQKFCRLPDLESPFHHLKILVRRPYAVMARNRQSKGEQWNVRPVSLTHQLIGLLQLGLDEVAGSNDYRHRPDHPSGVPPAQPPLGDDDPLDFRDHKIGRDEDVIP